MPKALVDTGAGPWVRRSLDAMDGCDPLVVVIGARADEVIALLPAGVAAVRNDGYQRGMGSSLQTGLRALPECDAVLVMLVDLPDVGAPVIRRILDAAGPAAGPGSRVGSALVRATYHGRPGHPVLIGRDHWPGVLATAGAGEGARRYFQDHPPTPVECGDLATGRDVDRPPR
jgi:CTP:molybdopterin cytidylyltransferase MocA